MSQVTSYTLADGDGVTVLAALNALFGAVQSVNSGTAGPSSPVIGMPWLDTSGATPTQRRRNATNTGWDLDDLPAVGLGLASVTAVSDVNALTLSGLYHASSGATGNPAGGVAYLLVHLSGATSATAVQLAFATTSDKINFRRKVASAWQAWAECPTGATATGLSVLQAATAAAARTAIAAYGATDLAVLADITAATAGKVLDAAVFTANKLILGTSQVTTSGTSKTFTGIPAWVKRVTMTLRGVSTTGTAAKLIQVGTSGGLVATGYTSESANAGGNTSDTTGFVLRSILAADAVSGAMVLTALGGGTWVASHACASGGGAPCYGGGLITGLGTLDRVALTTVGGTDTFDAGIVNVMWE